MNQPQQYPTRPGSSSGPAGPPYSPGEGQQPSADSSPLSHLLRTKASEVKQGMKDLTAASQVLAAETRSINTENERYKGSIVDTAVSAMTSQTDVINGQNPTGGAGNVEGRAMYGPGGTIRIEPPAQPAQAGSVAGGVPTKVDPTTAILTQTIAAGLGAMLNTFWISYVGADGAPADLLALMPGIAAWLILQGSATAFNNRKVK